MSHQQELERWEVRGKDLLHQTEAKASPYNRLWKRCRPFKKKWLRQKQTKNASRLIWWHRGQPKKNCAFRMRNCAGICKTRQTDVRKEVKNLWRHLGSFQCRSCKKSWGLRRGEMQTVHEHSGGNNDGLVHQPPWWSGNVVPTTHQAIQSAVHRSTWNAVNFKFYFS